MLTIKSTIVCFGQWRLGSFTVQKDTNVFSFSFLVGRRTVRPVTTHTQKASKKERVRLLLESIDFPLLTTTTTTLTLLYVSPEIDRWDRQNTTTLLEKTVSSTFSKNKRINQEKYWPR
jgi:hypothetical protein